MSNAQALAATAVAADSNNLLDSLIIRFTWIFF